MRSLLLMTALAMTTGGGCFQRWDRKTDTQVGISHPNSTTMLCKDIVRNPRPALEEKLCLCVNGKWLPLEYGGAEGSVDVQFFGDILGAAKKLCAIVDSIDCVKQPSIGLWVLDPTNFTLIGGPASNRTLYKSGLKRLVNRDGEVKYIDKQDIMSVIADICKFIDDGVGTIPGLLPDRGVDGIFGWLGRFIDGLFDFFDIFNNNIFLPSQLYTPSAGQRGLRRR